jgi:redox-sensitive bicupin YhaK (pirin superfamily)
LNPTPNRQVKKKWKGEEGVNNQTRKVSKVVQPQTVLEGAGVLLKRSFPTHVLDYPDPFLLFDHFGSDDPDDYLAGFPMHPHRGIETVTYMLAGKVNHRDSIGNSGSLGSGDLQWMTAGGGILHEEMPQPVAGRMEGFQLWVNLPARLKMGQPRYQEISAGNVPVVKHSGGASVKVIAGSLDGITGPVVGIAADPIYLDVTLDAGDSIILPATRSHTALAYLFRGNLNFGVCPLMAPTSAVPATEEELGGENSADILRAPRMVVFGDGDQVCATAGEKGARFLLMVGLASSEPIVRYGPFVMNTQEEIRQALRDLRDGTFVMR